MEKKFYPPKIIVEELTKIYGDQAKAITVAAGITHWAIVDPSKSGAEWLMSMFGLIWKPVNEWIEVRRHGLALRDAQIVQAFSMAEEILDDNYPNLIIKAIKEVGPLKSCGPISIKQIDQALAVFEEFINTKAGDKATLQAVKWGSAFDHPVVVADRIYKTGEVSFKRSSNMVYCDSCGELIACCEANAALSDIGEALCNYCDAEQACGVSHICESYECHAIGCCYSSWANLHQKESRKNDNSVQRYSESSGALF